VCTTFSLQKQNNNNNNNNNPFVDIMNGNAASSSSLSRCCHSSVTSKNRRRCFRQHHHHHHHRRIFVCASSSSSSSKVEAKDVLSFLCPLLKLIGGGGDAAKPRNRTLEVATSGFASISRIQYGKTVLEEVKKNRRQEPTGTDNFQTTLRQFQRYI